MFHGHWRHRRSHGPMFEKGALKYLMLDLINTKPRHGYDIIRELEESSGGCYSPSPGSIYPTLQMLEDLGHIVIKKENGKKVYEISDEGRGYLKTHEDSVLKHRQHMVECFGSPGSAEMSSMMREMKDLMHVMADLFRQIRMSAHRGALDKAKIFAIQEMVMNTKKEIERVIGETQND